MFRYKAGTILEKKSLLKKKRGNASSQIVPSAGIYFKNVGETNLLAD